MISGRIVAQSPLPGGFSLPYYTDFSDPSWVTTVETVTFTQPVAQGEWLMCLTTGSVAGLYGWKSSAFNWGNLDIEAFGGGPVYGVVPQEYSAFGTTIHGGTNDPNLYASYAVPTLRSIAPGETFQVWWRNLALAVDHLAIDVGAHLVAVVAITSVPPFRIFNNGIGNPGPGGASTGFGAAEWEFGTQTSGSAAPLSGTANTDDGWADPGRLDSGASQYQAPGPIWNELGFAYLDDASMVATPLAPSVVLASFPGGALIARQGGDVAAGIEVSAGLSIPGAWQMQTVMFDTYGAPVALHLRTRIRAEDAGPTGPTEGSPIHIRRARFRLD